MCDCYDGIVSDDQYGPIYCERCLVGLDLALAECVKRQAEMADSVAGYEPPETSRFWAAMHENAQAAIARLRQEQTRLAALRVALVAPAVEWAGRDALAQRQRAKVPA